MKCKECGGVIFFDNVEAYCQSCGLVADEAPINFGKEGFEDPDKPGQGRTGAPITWLNPGIGSTFNPKERGFKR
ncbi:hypothetical protein KY337_04440 [Candidatus Woesearchaeota archaeon]|nr:hypothetical protein [Candidatus Woesearchaeota archaeon]